MKCLECGNENFTIANVPESVEFKGESITVSAPLYVCDNCDFSFADTEQMNVLRKAVADKFRESKGLLTSEGIKSYRKKLGMSQTEFAEYLKVGDASIKRWETYFVQDESQDDHIRSRCDKNYSELTSLLLHDPDIYTGRKRFDLSVASNVILKLIGVFKSPLFINKALFYVDFLHYYKHNIGVTGAAYCSLSMGPCPDKYNAIFSYMENKDYIKKDRGHDYIVLKDIDEGVLADTHIDIIEQINKIGSEKGRKFLIDLSHDETGFLKNSGPGPEISYAHAKSLKIRKHL